jgi:DNA adenine methylase
MKPLFKWTGSKQRMRAQYETLFFPNHVDSFVDMFCGGLTNTLWVAEHYPNAKLHINDVNRELTQLYIDLAKTPDSVIHDWNNCVNLWFMNDNKDARKELYYGLRDAYVIQQRSGVLLFMLSVNFNGMWKAYKKCNLLYSTPPGTCTQKRKFFDEKNIWDVADLLSRCVITNKSYDKLELPTGSFVYADPPYRDSIVDYQGGFTEDDQKNLADILMAHDGQFAYSNKDAGDGIIQQWFDGANIHPMSAKYTAGRGKTVHSVEELLITNFTLL